MNDDNGKGLDLTPVTTALQMLVSASYLCQQTVQYGLANLPNLYLPITSGGLRNQFMNPAFQIAQRGVSFAALASGITYLSDRWYTNLDGTSTTDVAITAGPIAPLSDNGAQNYLTHQVTVAGTGGTIRNFVQHIEGVWTLSDQTVTVSGWLVADTNGRQVTVTATQVFGTGGSPSANVAATPASVTWTLTTTWTRYTATFQVPSVAGKTIGSSNDSYLAIVFGLPLNTAMTISFAGMQCEEGPVATPLEVRPNAVEKQMCLRYYQIGSIAHWSIASAAGETIGSTTALPVPMRASPTVVFSGSSLNNCSTLTYWTALTNDMGYWVLSLAAGQVGFSFNYTLSADL
jgi:hypothetical protein